jgi:hypothetical protein
MPGVDRTGWPVDVCNAVEARIALPGTLPDEKKPHNRNTIVDGDAAADARGKPVFKR